MNISLNNQLTLSADPDGGAYIIEEVRGLGLADIRTSSFLYSGRGGGMVTDQHEGFRVISIEGTIGRPGGTRQQHKLDRQALINALPIGTTMPVYITMFDNQTYRIVANVTSAPIEYKRGGYESEFYIQFTAGDPLFYSTDGGDEQTATISRMVDSGGYVTPYDLPVNWQGGGAPTIVMNNGNATVYPTIELNNIAHSPAITNQATGETFSLDISTVGGDKIVINMFNRTVTLNGSNILGNRKPDSHWWGLLPGSNPIALNTTSTGDNVTGTIKWRNGLTGI